MDLESVAIGKDEKVEAVYKDGGLFWGHWIIVKMDKEFNLTDADIAG